MHVITLPEGTYGSNAACFLSTFHAECFPELADKQIEIIRVHRIGPEYNADGPGTLSFRLPMERGVRFCLEILLKPDVILYIIKHCCAFAQIIYGKGISLSVLPNLSYIKTQFFSDAYTVFSLCVEEPEDTTPWQLLKVHCVGSLYVYRLYSTHIVYIPSYAYGIHKYVLISV